MAKVRKLGRRVVAGGALLSDEPEWRKVQIRMIGSLSFFVLGFALLAHGKLERLWGDTIVHLADAVIGLVIIVLIVRRVRARGVPVAEPKDEELELPAQIVEEQLSSGALTPRDLVFERGIWGTLGDSQQFSIAAEAPIARERSRAQRLLAVQVIAGIVLAMSVVLFFFNLGDILMWLSH